MKLNIEAPINSLSLGNVTINFLRELSKKGVDYSLFPIGNNADFNAYDKLDPAIRQDIIDRINNRFNKYVSNIPCLKVWHINGSQNRVSKEQYLYTFYECSKPTLQEVNIVQAQKHVFFSSQYAADLFKQAGCDNVSAVPLGFDPDMNSGVDTKVSVIHFSLIGKFEKRKNTKKIIRSWVELYGDKPGYQLTLLVGNPFCSDDEFKALLGDALQKNWSNVNILGRLTTNSEISALHKATDIDLSGLSGGEGWNLPSFNATCLGKWSVVSNCSSHKDWATEDNCILVEPDGKEPCHDGKFFVDGNVFNQGEFYYLSEDSIKNGIQRAVGKFKEQTVNKEGLKLRDEFTYEKTIQKILDVIES